MSDPNSNLPTPTGNNPGDATRGATSNTGSSPDPKLRSFLRQAAAIITAERGLNDVTSAKLQLLAERLRLSDETFDKAMHTLKEPKRDLIQMSRYEQAFVDLLEKELPQIPRRILTIKMEQQLIDIADRKYQISEIRAQQLIQKTAEACNVGTISHADAEHFAAQLIVDSIGTSTRIDPQQIQGLYGSCQKWGLTDPAVDKIVKRVIARNRSRRRLSFLTKGLVLVMGAAIIGGIGYAILTIDWFADRNVAKPKNEPAHVAAAADPTTLAWWPDRIKSKLAQWKGEDQSFDFLVNDLASHDSQSRGLKYLALTQSLLDLTGTFDVTFEHKIELAAALYYAEPDDKNAAQLVAPLLEAIDAHNGSVPLVKSQVSRAHRANELLARIRFFPRAESDADEQVDRRRQILDDEIIHFFGSSYNEISRYLRETEKDLLIDQWNHAIKIAYESPSRAAVLVPEIEAMSNSILDERVLGELRTRALHVILESDLSNWATLKPIISAAIRDAGSAQVHAWISLLLRVDDRSCSDFLSNQLVQRTRVQPPSSSRKDILDSLRDHQLQGTGADLQALVLRFEVAQSIVTQVQRNLESTALSDLLTTADGREQLPELIAQLAFATNLMLALGNAMDSDADPSDPFFKFDTLRSEPLPRISLVANSGQSTVPNFDVRGTPTPSEIRTKRDSIDRLLTTDESRIATRKTAIRTLAEIAKRFDDLDYAEASEFASYLMGEKTMEEWLAIEQALPRFSHWSMLKLAIADQLPNSQIKIDQALTLTTILSGTENQFNLGGDWRREIRLWLMKQALDHVKGPANDVDSQSTWNQLRNYLARAYAFRASVVGGQSNSPFEDPDQDICEPILQVLRTKLASDDLAERNRLQFAIQRVNDGDDGEIGRCVMVNQILIDSLLDQIENVSRDDDEIQELVPGDN